MIYPHALTPLQKRKSQFNFNMYNVVNGLSYMCLGETVLILLAVKINSPDYVISTLGAMIYLGFLLLPLGKYVTGRMGAARSQAFFWVCRNVAALVVASAALLSWGKLPILAIAALLIGSFFFYGFRAAGVIMSQPLIGDITDDSSRAKLLSFSWGLFNLCCLFSLIVINVVMKFNSSLWMLMGIIGVGAALGLFASTFIRKIDETAELKKSARKPIRKDWIQAWRNPDFRRLLRAEFIANLGVIMVMPISMLTLKRGYGIDDAHALFFALVQFASSALVCFVSVKLMAKIGSRRLLIISFGEMLLAALLWIAAPPKLNWFHAGAIFVLIGAGNVNIINCVADYFLQVVKPKYRVSTSVFRSLVTNAGAGIVGMILTGALLKLLSLFGAVEIAKYRYYFMIALVVLAPGILTLRRLTKLKPKKF